MSAHIGLTIADARRARHWSLRELSVRTGITVSWLHAIEHGRSASLTTYAGIAAALGRELRVDLIDPRARASARLAEDPVHAAMGEMLAGRLRSFGIPNALDEPYQHYQFAGKADFLAWDFDRRALLHVENRTRFPNLQEAIGSYNAKRRYLPAVIAERLGIPHGFAVVTHVIAGCWTSEVLHSIRLRPMTFRGVCPDTTHDFEAWWSGRLPEPGDPTSTLILLDPIPDTQGRRATFIGLDQAVRTGVRPRYRGYAEVAAALRDRGLA
jgi:transcriptional regulator with XRE-family HTH domain